MYYIPSACCANEKFFSSRLELVIKIERTLTRPIVKYASETCVLKETTVQKLLVFERKILSIIFGPTKETTVQKLLVFERKILRIIFGPTKENQIWRIKTNEELNKMIKHKNMVNYIKAHRLSWFGHLQRMPDARTVKKIFKWNPLTKRSQGKPKYRWEDNVKQDICQMKVKNWITCVQDREKWKNVVEKGITFNN